MTPSDTFIKRLVSYYKTHTELSCLPLWTGTYADLREYLTKEDVGLIRKKLDELYISDLWGIDYNQKNDWNLPPYETCFDTCLKTIAYEMGISKESVIEQLEYITNLKLDIPEYPHRPVIKVGDRNIPLRLLVCYYAFYGLMKNFKTVPKQALEIGAGTGYFPYLFCRRYPELKYNIIDLPVISVLQTYIYASMVGEDKIWFHGEPKSDAELRIYSPDAIDDIEVGVDVALNLNSFPEIPPDIQSKYLALIRKILTPDGFFYSINWEPTEGQRAVTVACDESKFTKTHRRNFPVESNVHHGGNIPFFEEIYKP